VNLINLKLLKYHAEDGKNVSIKVIDKDNKMYGVPLDEDNMDYAEIKRQVDAGELTIEDAD